MCIYIFYYIKYNFITFISTKLKNLKKLNLIYIYTYIFII